MIVDYRKTLKNNQNWRNKALEHSISKLQKHENQFVHRFEKDRVYATFWRKSLL